MWELIFIVNLHMPGTGLNNLRTSFHEIISTTFWCGLIIHPIVSLRKQSLKEILYLQFSSVQFLSCVWLCATPWIVACQASPSITNPRSLFKLMSIELVMSSSHLILCWPFSSCLQSFPASGSFLKSQFFASGGQYIGASASASVLPMNIQDWFPLGWTGWISLQCEGLSRVFSNTTVQKHQFFGAHIHIWLLHKCFDWWTFVGKVLSLLFNMLSTVVITFLPRSKHLLISWLQSPWAVILEPPKIKSATVSIVSPSICH